MNVVRGPAALIAMAFTLALIGILVAVAMHGTSGPGPAPSSTASARPTSGATTSVPWTVESPGASASMSACRADVVAVTDAAEAFYAAHNYYAKSVAALVAGGFLRSAPSEVRYGYENPEVVPTITGAGC